MKIYASYTRDQYESTIKRMIADLKMKGFEVIDPTTSLSNFVNESEKSHNK